MATEYGRYSIGVETNHSDTNTDPSGASGEASIFVSGSGTAAKFYQVNGNGDKGTVLTTDIVSGDATMSAAGALTIAAGAVENSMLADDAVDSDEIAAGAIDTAHIADNQVTLAKMAGLARGKLIYGDASGDPAALAAGGNGKLLVADANGDLSWTTLSGDATLSAGALTIAATSVEGSMLNNNVVSGLTDIGADFATTDEILVSDNGTIRRADLSRFSPLLAGTVTTSGLADNSGVLQVDINNLTAETAVTDADLVMVYDATASALRKMTRANFIESVALDSINIDGGAIDGTPIGANSAAAGTFAALKWSSLSGSGNAEVVGTIASTGAIASSGSITAGSSFIIGSADMNEADLEKLDGITNGTAAASKAVVLDASKNIATLGTVGCGAITSTGASSMGSLNIGGTLACDTSFTIDAVVLNATELGYLDSTTAGTSAASKAMVTDASGDILMPDSDKFELGASSDMQLYHDGTNSFIANKTGALKIATETSGIAVTIGHSTSEVTVADNLTVSGNLTVTGTTITDSVEVISTSSGVLFEGGTDDGHEGTLISAVAGADVTYTLPNLTGHIPLLAGAASNANVTAAEFHLLDGGSTVDNSVTVADGDGVLFNDGGTMKQVDVRALAGYFDDEITAMPNLVTVGTIGSGVWNAGAVTSSGRIVSDDATEATSTTDGSLQTDGGLSVAKSAVIGDDLDLLSDGAILNFGADKEVTLTHVHNEGLLLAGGNHELQFRDSDLYISGENDGVLELAADTSIMFDTDNVLFTSSTSDAPTVAIKNTNADANPGTLLFQHDSASPADDDELGEVVFNGDDDGGNDTMFAKIVGVSTDVSNGSEDGMLEFKYQGAGAVKEWQLGGGAGLVGPNDSTYGTVKAHSFVTYSDESLKTNFKALDNPLEMVKKLNGLNYTWKSDGSKDIGFIAQEVEKVVPEVVYSNGGEAGSYGMDYSSLTALLTEAIKQQDGEITALKATLSKVLSSQEELLKKLGVKS